MVKVYYTYSFDKVIGQAISKQCNFVYQPKDKLFITGVNQYIAIISSKTGQVIRYLHKQNKNIPVRHIYLHSQKIYAGYEDGQIVVWSISTQEQLFTFDLHKSTVSSIVICQEQSKLISAGFDGNIMIWDLITQQCQSIKSAHPSMITQVQVTNILIKGRPTSVILSIGKDGFFRVWNMNTCLCLTAISCNVTQVYSMYLDISRNLVFIGTNKQQILTIQFQQSQDFRSVCKIRGVFKKKSYARCVEMFVDHSIMYIFNSDKTIQIYKMLSGKQLEARKKRLLNRKKKAQQQAQQPEQAQAQLKFIEQKVIPFKFYNGYVIDNRIFLNNGTNIYELGADHQLTQGIGRTQQICLEYPFTVQRSPNMLNVYSSNTSTKLFSINAKAQWCSLFSGGYLLVVAMESVHIWNLLKNQEVYKLQQKWSGCWVKKNKCLLWRENQLGIFQIGYDKLKSIKMKMVQSKKFQDKITQACYKNQMDKYIVNLQNSQVIINYADTHKMFLKLYGHKLPILSFDISSDDALLATGSVDKDIRLWDMDFGHSIKSIFAHQQAVTAIRFVPETHYLFSGSKDGHIKFWDMDTYQLIMDFEESTMQIKCLAISQSGDFFIAGGIDEGIRIWKQTNDQTIATDMQQKQMEKVMIEDYAKQKLDQQQSKTRYEDLKHGQQIIQALQNKQTPKTIITLIKKIPPGNLKSCLSFLHERHVRRLQQYLKLLISGNYEQQVCWRTIRQLNRGSQLGSNMRQIWKPVQKLIQLNTEILKIWKKQVQQENQLIK